MLGAIRKRYGVWTARALLGVTNGSGRVAWPVRGEYETELGLFVGPDARRWAWCAPPPGQLQMPNDFRVEGVRVAGRTAGGQDFSVAESAPSALSAGSDTPTRVLLRSESPELTFRHQPRQGAPAQVEWTLINALFEGIDWSPIRKLATGASTSFPSRPARGGGSSNGSRASATPTATT